MMKRTTLLASLFLLTSASAFLSPKSQSFLGSKHAVGLPASSSSSSSSSSLATSTTTSTTSTNEETNKKLVKRYHESFKWTNPKSKQTHNINYKVQGNKQNPPILLIHGFGANVNHFRYNFPDLVEAGHCVYAIDLLGFGGSDKPKDEEYCIELWITLLCDFIQQMDDDDDDNENDHKWVVAGNSIGGLCSLGVAAQLQETIRGVTLFNCAGGMTSFRYDELPFFLQPILYFVQKVVLAPDGYGGKFFQNFKTRENVQSILLKQGVYGDTSNVDEELLEILLGPSDDDGAKEVFLKVFGGPPGPTPESLLPQIDVPILALWGSSDPWTPLASGLHPGSEFGTYAKGDYKLHVLDGAGHCPHDENPTEVNEQMIKWLKEL